MYKNAKSIKELYTNSKGYELFKMLIDSSNNTELTNRLEILDNYFLTYKYPKILEYGYYIIDHTGENGSDYMTIFVLGSYEFFLKENDDELFRIWQSAEDIWKTQYQINGILNNTEKESF